MTVVHKPERRHVCAPGVERRKIDRESLYGPPVGSTELIPPDPWRYPRGTVVQCECGRTWVSEGSPAAHMPGFCTFRREGWFERRRRERATGGAR
jgi:hypothetical protein